MEGLTEREMSSYRQALEMLLEGEKTRKMATTLMNTESSRSHAIFTIRVHTQIVEEEVTRVKRSKLHIVDLAGSERVKHTNVEGERLREGCNINRSLHVLGNVINSLVESSRKKKHVPYRDSKLTHYLKDSLGGNSITKLLANVHTNKFYFGDTLSTLMFAKRAKILKTKVELNRLQLTTSTPCEKRCGGCEKSWPRLATSRLRDGSASGTAWRGSWSGLTRR